MTVLADAKRRTASPGTRALRVLHIHSGNMIGGIESMLRTLAEFAPACPDFKQEIALVFDGPFADSLRSAGMVVRLLPSAQLRNPFSVLRSRRALRDLLKSKSFDAAISHSTWCQVVYGPAFKSTGVPVIFWMHGSFDGHWLQKLASRHAPNHVICNSEYSRSTLSQVYPRVPSTVVHYPVQTPVVVATRESLRNELGAQPDTVVILMASRMEHWKGHFNLLHAAAQLKSRSDWIIWVAGAPQTSDERSYHRSLLEEVKRLRLESRTRFLGYRSDVPALMRAADIFCQPNADPEPYGIVFVEALQAGVPVVTFNMGGPKEILDMDSGFLIAPGDIAELAAALARLIDDPVLRSRFRDTGPARAASICDPAQQLRRLHEMIASVPRVKELNRHRWEQ